MKVKKPTVAAWITWGIRAGSASVKGLGLSSTLRARLFDGDSDGNPTFG